MAATLVFQQQFTVTALSSCPKSAHVLHILVFVLVVAPSLLMLLLRHCRC
ncbi:hypothetical protein WN944_003388 [Citrus x changshan-huyou]|uniref:Uncharacterized protein n=1 Tax=Citrus x changshan-huyou TaxID=2935761 RepID=A0AAP0M1J4_9ROSI